MSARDDFVWWRDGVLYEVYVRSFADSNGDGIGDLRGIIGRLDYLSWLGVDGLWLTPTFPSPNTDWGYDVADYCGVHSEYGSMEDLDELADRAHARGMGILLDLVPNHTSDRHPWFVQSCAEPGSKYRDYYVWRDPQPDGSPPNNWRSVFAGSAWELDGASGQYYLHNFLKTQPDLNWWSDDVRAEFDRILRFWFDRGIDGFRIDVAHGIVKDRSLRDNVPATEDDPSSVRRVGQRAVYSMNRPEVHDVLKRWRVACDESDPPRVLVGETWILELERMASFYGQGNDELHLAFNFPFIYSPLSAPQLSRVVETTESLVPEESWPVWAASNHDVGRFATRWCGDDQDRVRCGLVLLLTLRGTPFLYYGDEIGMPDAPPELEYARDPIAHAYWPEDRGRDGCRTPMQWSSDPGAGFTASTVAPWLPLDDASSCNVAGQRDDPESALWLCRDLIALRRNRSDLQRGRYETVTVTDSVWLYRRGEEILVALNLSDAPAELEEISGTVLVGTRRARYGERIAGRLWLDSWESLVVHSPST
jgi:alpha-glucosidase